MAIDSPKVFISHASEDKERFVVDFATKLRERRIDVWVDQWEMLPGDSLIDKVFEEGIENAQAMIIVLSHFSVQKPWVRAELNAGAVKRINSKYKLIPVVIDDCEVPAVLRSIVWEHIRDINSYNQELDRIVSSIYGHTEKPSLGSPPKYTQLEIDKLPELTREDTLVFKIICEVSLEIDGNWISIEQFQNRTNELGISDDSLYESIDVLAENYFIKGTRISGSRGLDFFDITGYGFEAYARVFLPSFNELINQVLVSIVNHNLQNNEALVMHLNKPRVLIDYALDTLERRGFVETVAFLGGGIDVGVTTKGQRAARNLQGN